MADPLLVQSKSAYTSPIAENSNVRYVENRIIINAHHAKVYDYVTTWANLPKWLPVAKGISVRKGNPNEPSKFGDILCEEVFREEGSSAPATTAPKIYTVAVQVPGAIWTIAGVDDVPGGDPWIGKTVTFTTIPLEHDRTLFCRVFQQIRKESDEMSEDRHPVLQPAAMQEGLLKLKALIEEDAANNEAPVGFWGRLEDWAWSWLSRL